MGLASFRILSFCLLSSPFLRAQDARGSLVGKVSDQQGAMVSGAEVTVLNNATNIKLTAKTNEAGSFIVPYLLPGTYKLTVELTGFKRFVQDGIQVRVNDTVEVNPGLEVGDTAQSVEVKAETPLLSTAEASLGQVIDERRVTELPLFAGNAMDLVHLAPGTVNGTNLRLRKAPFNAAPSQFATDGNGNNNNEFSIDGVTNVYSDGTAPRVAFSPPQTALAEFKIQTSAFDASLGRTIGSTVNVSTKAGTNQFHGEMHHWLRNRVFDSLTIFQNRVGQKAAVYQDNRYGASAGAPVIIPGLYNGRNRTFWFYAWEANKFGDPNVGQATNTVPVEASRRGDLSYLLAGGASYQVYDPFSTVAAPNGIFTRTPLARNQIPASRLDPVAQNIIKFWPSANQPGLGVEQRNNFFLTGKALEDYWVHLFRVDHAWNDKNRMFVRGHRDYWEEDKNRNFGPQAPLGVILNRRNRGLALDDVHVFNPSFLVNLRYGLTQQEFPERRVSRGFDLASLGFAPNVLATVDRQFATFPNTTVAPWSALSSWESGDGVTASLIHSFYANFTKLVKSHNIRFGPEMRVTREFRNRFPFDVSPQLSFGAGFTSAASNLNAPQLGGQIAQFLMGIPNGQMGQTASYAEQDKYWGIYIQDDWKVTRKLTLNLGLRTEHESPVTERFNRAVASFAYDQANPLDAPARAAYARAPIPDLPAAAFRALGGLTFVGSNNRDQWKGQGFVFMPRIGFAYQALAKTVVRAGYGTFYNSIGVLQSNTVQTGFSQNTPIQPSLDNGLTYVANNRNLFPAGLTPPRGSADGLATNLGQGVTFFPAARKQPYAQRWSFGIQQELPMQWLLEVSYVGNRAVRLNVARALNATSNSLLSTSPTRDQARITLLAQQFSNPFFGLNPIYGRNISREDLLRPYPHFGGVSVQEPIGYSWYHSAQMRLERRFSQGYTLQFGHTWSKAMGATGFLNGADARLEEVISDLDRTHRFTASGIWEIPVGKGRRFGSGMNSVMNFLAGGWQLNGLNQFQSGAPLGFGNRIVTGDLRQVVLPEGQRGVDGWFRTTLVGTTRRPVDFVWAAGDQLGSNVRTLSSRFGYVRGPVQFRLDGSLIKNFRVRDRATMQFRAECFNATNFTNLAGPNTDPTSTAFGAITGQDSPRSWQLALKLSW